MLARNNLKKWQWLYLCHGGLDEHFFSPLCFVKCFFSNMIWETIIGDVDMFLWTKDFKKCFYLLLELLTISLELLQLFVEVVIQGHFDCFVTMLIGDDLKNNESIFDMANCIKNFFHPWVLLNFFCNIIKRSL